MTGLFLHWASLILSLVGLFCVMYAGVIELIKNWKTIRENLTNWKHSAELTSHLTNKGRGESHVFPTLITALCCLVLITVPVAIALAKYFNRFPIYTLENVQVISSEESKLPGYSYWMEYDSASMGRLTFLARFCPDYKPPFDPGDVLEFLRYEDHRDCWSLKDEYTGVKIRRDSHGRTDSELRNERPR